jgi:hypothetical protein
MMSKLVSIEPKKISIPVWAQKKNEDEVVIGGG